MPLPSGLRAFHHPDFRRFFIAQFVAQVGSWMQTVAQSWLVLQLTSSPLRKVIQIKLAFAAINNQIHVVEATIRRADSQYRQQDKKELFEGCQHKCPS